ncbi:MAG: ferredoxin [Anaerolineaceae bacterium]
MIRVKVDKITCIACGNCEATEPAVFSLQNSAYSIVIEDPVTLEHEKTALQAVDECPATAISFEELDEEPEAHTEHEETTPAALAGDVKEQKVETEEKVMKAVVDKDLCIGCGICEGVAPEVFSLATEPYAVVIQTPVAEENQEAARQAAEDCPETAITIEE